MIKFRSKQNCNYPQNSFNYFEYSNITDCSCFHKFCLERVRLRDVGFSSFVLFIFITFCFSSCTFILFMLYNLVMIIKTIVVLMLFIRHLSGTFVQCFSNCESRPPEEPYKDYRGRHVHIFLLFYPF